MGKKVLIALGVLVVAGLIAAAVFFVIIPRMNGATGQPDGTSQNVAASNGQSQVENRQPVSTEDVSTSLLSDGDSEQYMEADKEIELVESFVSNLMESAKSNSALAMVSSNPIDGYSINGDIIDTARSQRSFESFYNGRVFTSPSIYSTTFICQTGQIARYSCIAMANVVSNAAGSARIGGDVNSAFLFDVYVNSVTSEIAAVVVDEITPYQIPDIEEDYTGLSLGVALDRAGQTVFEGDGELIKAMLAGIFSYSVYIDQIYWSNVEQYLFTDASNVPGNVSSLDEALSIGWRPSGNGSGIRLVNIGEPQLLNVDGTSQYYACDIVYRTDHNDGHVMETQVQSTLLFYYNADAKMMWGLTENNASSTTGVADPSDKALSPSMFDAIGVNVASRIADLGLTEEDLNSIFEN